MNCGLDTSANDLMQSLLEGVDIKIPNVDLDDDIYKYPGDINSDLYKAIKPLENEAVTTRELGGSGAFDAFMDGITAHLDRQFKLNRISGDDYAKTYIALTEVAMTNAVQFALQKETVKWAAIAAQLDAITARVLLEIEKNKLAATHIDALKAKTQYAQAKAELVITSVQHCAEQYRYENLLPKENLVLIKQIDGLEVDNKTKTFNLTTILPAQHRGLELDNEGKDYTVKNIMPADYRTKVFNLTELMPAQKELINEQTEVQIAQTLDTRSDGQTVVGTLGKQKDLYTQQIESYKRNAETNAAKMFLDAWITQKTLDEGLLPPDALKNASVDTVLSAIKSANNLG